MYKINDLLSTFQAAAISNAKETEARWRALDEVLRKQKEWAEQQITSQQREFEDTIAENHRHSVLTLTALSSSFDDALAAVALGIKHLQTEEPQLRIGSKSEAEVQPTGETA